MLRSAMLAVSRNNAVKRAVVGFGPTSRVVDRFVAGEALDQARTHKDPAYTAKLERRLEQYRKRNPWREDSP